MTVAKVKDMEELKPQIVEVDGVSIGVFLFKGRYFAYRDTCPHQGGPSVEGETLGNTECEIMPNGRRRVYVNVERVNIVCPWHGIEYDIETGVCRADKRMRLKHYDVVVEDDDVKIRI